MWSSGVLATLKSEVKNNDAWICVMVGGSFMLISAVVNFNKYFIRWLEFGDDSCDQSDKLSMTFACVAAGAKFY